jgi:hypothetical protein
MKKSIHWVLLCAFVLGVPWIQGLHFYLEQAKDKCFLEELPRDTIVLGKYAFNVALS